MFQRVLLESLALAGAAIDKSEILISPTDMKRADGCIWHPALSARGVAIDVTVWSDFTLARLLLSATTPHHTLTAAEAFKTAKYRDLCDACNLDFEALAANPQGGFGPNLLRVWQAVWTHRTAEARAAHQPTRPIASLERRCLERLSAEFAKHLHRAIYHRTTDRTATTADLVPDVDGDAHAPTDM